MTPTADPPAEGPRRGERPPRPPSDAHRRAVAAVQALSRLCPLEAARWIRSRAGKRDDALVDACWIEQPPRGPTHVVPTPRAPEDHPPTQATLLNRALTGALEEEAKASQGETKLEVVRFDFAEAQRQSMAEGGSEVELRLRLEHGPARSSQALLGVMLPDEHEDGTETPWRVLRKSLWHMLAGERLFGHGHDTAFHFQTAPLYLWPGTGLRDPQENCSVLRGEIELPGLLGALVKHQDEAQRVLERDRSRGLNQQRLERQRALDQQRREAAARRRALTGDAGITEAELAALVPDIDVERDRITMIQVYDTVRLWEEPVDALLDSLPPACVGLAMFGWRPADQSAASVLERCAFTLRRALRGAAAVDAQRAARSLSALGGAVLDPDEVTRLLGRMRLL